MKQGLTFGDIRIFLRETPFVLRRVASISGAASDSVSFISALQLGQVIVGSVMWFSELTAAVTSQIDIGILFSVARLLFRISLTET